MNLTTLPVFPTDPIQILGYQLLIHELTKPHYPNLVPLGGLIMEETMISIHGGTFHTFLSNKEFITYPIDLVHTHEFVLVMDYETNEILADIKLNVDVFCISIEKQALIMRLGQEIWMLRVKNRSVFYQLLHYIPQVNLVDRSSESTGGENI